MCSDFNFFINKESVLSVGVITVTSDLRNSGVLYIRKTEEITCTNCEAIFFQVKFSLSPVDGWLTAHVEGTNVWIEPSKNVEAKIFITVPGSDTMGDIQLGDIVTYVCTHENQEKNISPIATSSFANIAAAKSIATSIPILPQAISNVANSGSMSNTLFSVLNMGLAIFAFVIFF